MTVREVFMPIMGFIWTQCNVRPYLYGWRVKGRYNLVGEGEKVGDTLYKGVK